MPKLTDITNSLTSDIAAPTQTIAPLIAANFVEMGKDTPDSKIEIYLADRDLRIRLQPAQLAILRLYDGQRSTADVLDYAARQNIARFKPAALKAFEVKILKLGFLIQSTDEDTVKLDPFAGIEYGLTKQKPPQVFFNLDDTNRSLGPVLAFLMRPAGHILLMCLMVLVAYGVILSFQGPASLWTQLPRLMNEVWWVFLSTLSG